MTWFLSVLVTFLTLLNATNFIIFFADDMGYGDLSYMGHPTIYTPNIDKLAREGMYFTQWYSAFDVCSPSRAAMLTGRLPIRSGMGGTSWTGGVLPAGAVGGLPDSEITLASLMQQNGYTTKILGKWHLGQRAEYLPLNRGFDESFIIPYSVDMGSSPYQWWKNGTWGEPVLSLLKNDTVIEQPVDLSTISKRYVNEVIDFISNSVSNNKPFFLYFPHSHMHIPIFTNEQFCNSSIRGRYGDGISELDWVIGQIMEYIDQNDLSDDTMTFFTSDNGPWINSAKLAGGSAGLFKQGKQTTWEGGIREPGIIHWPNKIQPNSRSMEVVATYDIFPTILSVANIPLPENVTLDGYDLSDILFNDGATPHECIYIWGGTPGYGNNLNGDPCVNSTDCPGLYALRCGDYKMHWVTKSYNSSAAILDEPLLFNINWDPSENHPIWPTDSRYDHWRPYFEQKKQEHLNTIKYVTNQNALGRDPQYFTCGAPNSQNQYPQYPNCTMTPDNWNQFICTPTCYAWDNCHSHGGTETSKIYAPL